MSQNHSETSFEESNCAGYRVVNFVGNKQPHLSGGCQGLSDWHISGCSPLLCCPLGKCKSYKSGTVAWNIFHQSKFVSKLTVNYIAFCLKELSGLKQGAAYAVLSVKHKFNYLQLRACSPPHVQRWHLICEGFQDWKLFYGLLSFGIPKIEMRAQRWKENWLRSHSKLMAKLELAQVS